MLLRALCSKTRFENQSSPKYLGFQKMDIYFCPFSQTPTTFGQNFQIIPSVTLSFLTLFD
jgi:hypothetical protein